MYLCACASLVPRGFPGSNIEKLGVAWGRRYMYSSLPNFLGQNSWLRKHVHTYIYIIYVCCSVLGLSLPIARGLFERMRLSQSDLYWMRMLTSLDPFTVARPESAIRRDAILKTWRQWQSATSVWWRLASHSTFSTITTPLLSYWILQTWHYNQEKARCIYIFRS